MTDPTPTEPVEASVIINAPVEITWTLLTDPVHVAGWNDGDITGMPTRTEEPDFLAYTLPDGRHVEVTLAEQGDATTLVVQRVTPDPGEPAAVQRAGWQALLDRFAAYAGG